MSEPRSQPWVTYVLIAANVAMFGVELAMGGDPMAPAPRLVIDLGGNFPPRTLNGEWWRLVSSMFLHVGVIHLGVNMLSLYRLRAAELMFGRIGFAVLYAIAGLGGGIANLMVSNGSTVTVGASGALFGIFGAYGMLLVLRRARFPPDAWRKAMWSFGQLLVLNVIIGVAVPRISMSAHIGGFIVGAAIGAALLVGVDTEQSRSRRALIAAALGIALTGAAVLAIPAPADMQPLLHRYDTLERSVPNTINAALKRHDANEITEADLVAQIERDAVAPYGQLLQDLRAATGVPARLKPLTERIDAAIAAELASLKALEAALAEHDPAKRKQRFATRKDDKERVEAARQAVTAELARLNDARKPAP